MRPMALMLLIRSLWDPRLQGLRAITCLPLVDGVALAGVQTGMLHHPQTAILFYLLVFSGGASITTAMTLSGNLRQRLYGVLRVYAVVMIGAVSTVCLAHILAEFIDARWLAPFAAWVLLGMAADASGISNGWLKAATDPRAIVTVAIATGGYHAFAIGHLVLNVQILHSCLTSIDAADVAWMVVAVAAAAAMTMFGPVAGALGARLARRGMGRAFIGESNDVIVSQLTHRATRSATAGLLALVVTFVLGYSIPAPLCVLLVIAVAAAAFAIRGLRIE